MAAETSQNEERFEVGSGSELSVSNVSGRTNVSAIDGSEIIVRYTKRGWGSKDPQNAQVEVSQSGNRVTIQTRMRGSGLLNFSRSAAVEYDISVPRDCAVNLQSVSADTTLEGTRGDTGIRTVSGDVNIRNVAGDISITTVSGDVFGNGLVGTLIGRTTSGDTTVRTSKLRRFSLNSVSGDFSIETSLPENETSNAKTVSGDLTLLLPPSNGATVELRSVSGSVSCELPGEVIKAGRRHWQGRVNGGGAHVDMNSVSGDLVVRKGSIEEVGYKSEGDSEPRSSTAEDVSIQSPESTIADESDQDRPEAQPDQPELSDLLAAVERGELSIEDAMSRLA